MGRSGPHVRQRVSHLALDQNRDPLDPGNVQGQSFNQRIHSELFAQNAGSVLVCESCVEIDYGRAWVTR